MSKPSDNRLVRCFAERRAAGKRTLVPFITAGYPDLEATEALLGDFAPRGVSVCELGIPFSDPVADGPVIQASYTEALAAGISSDAIFEMVRRFRRSAADLKSEISDLRSRMALVAMVSYSIVFRHGVEAYLSSAAEAGFDGLIVPDLPLEEAAVFEAAASAAGLCNIMLVAPTTPADRRLEIARHSRGFLYFISVAGITGERKQLPESSLAAVAELRTHTDLPICIGFGVSDPQAVAHVCETADGAIVGSAIVHRITDAKDKPREQLVREVGDFVSALLKPIA